MAKALSEITREEYPIMWKRERVGTFIEERLPNNALKVTMILDKNKRWPMLLKVLQKDGFVDWKMTRWFIENRVTPSYQDGIEDKLEEMGMKYYDAYLIFRDGNGFNEHDFVWFAFNEDLTFDKVHPRAHLVE